MSEVEFFKTARGRTLAYRLTPGTGPCIVFLSGLMSDMEGTKAVRLCEWAQAQGLAFLRFDYSGHGQSSGRFEEGCIGDWAEDTQEIVNGLTHGPLLLVGSSMGGWQALLLGRQIPERVAGMVTIAAAPDFTEDGYWASFTAAQKKQLEDAGKIEIASDYMEPYIITRRMIEDGRTQLVLRSPLDLPFPVRCLQGLSDSVVSAETALRLLKHANCPDMSLVFVKDADHRFSDEPCLALIEDTIQDLLSGSTR